MHLPMPVILGWLAFGLRTYSVLLEREGVGGVSKMCMCVWPVRGYICMARIVLCSLSEQACTQNMRAVCVYAVVRGLLGCLSEHRVGSFDRDRE